MWPNQQETAENFICKTSFFVQCLVKKTVEKFTQPNFLRINFWRAISCVYVSGCFVFDCIYVYVRCTRTEKNGTFSWWRNISVRNINVKFLFYAVLSLSNLSKLKVKLFCTLFCGVWQQVDSDLHKIF